METPRYNCTHALKQASSIDSSPMTFTMYIGMPAEADKPDNNIVPTVASG